MNDKSLRNVGTTVLRIGARERVLGSAKFASDLHRDGMVTLLALRSDRPHARILSVDASQAVLTPGCVRVFTYEDIEEIQKGLEIMKTALEE